MNKMLIILLAVCLVSAHAFVKRDSSVAAASDMQKQLTDLQAKFEELGKSFTEVFDVAPVHKKLEEALEIAKQALDKIKSSDARPAA